MQKGEFRGHAAMEAALEAALSLLPGPAFAFDADGQVLAANVAISDDHLTRARACLLNPDPHRARLARREPAAVVLLVETERDAALARAKQRWRLTPKQTEILGHLVSGASNKEIATLLDCSLSNVEGDHRGVLGGAMSVRQVAGRGPSSTRQIQSDANPERRSSSTRLYTSHPPTDRVGGF